MTNKMIECLNALVQADPDAAETTLLRVCRLGPEAAAKLPFRTKIGHRGDAEVTPLNILNACLRQSGEDSIGYVINKTTHQITHFVSKKTMENVELIEQYEGEYLKLIPIDKARYAAAHLGDTLVIKVTGDRWDVYKGVSFDVFTDLVMSADPANVMAKELGHRPYAMVSEEPK